MNQEKNNEQLISKLNKSCNIKPRLSGKGIQFENHGAKCLI